MVKKIAIIAGVALIAVGIAIGVGVLLARRSVPSSVVSTTETFTDQGVTFKYPNILSRQEPSAQEISDKFIFRASEPAGERPLLIEVRYETGIEKAANVTRKPALQMLLENARRAYPSQYPQYKEVSSREFDFNNRRVAELVYTYVNDNVSVKKRFIIIMKNSDTGLYFSFQAKDADFSDLDIKYFEPIFRSITIQ